MYRFNRDYKLTIKTNNRQFTIKPDIRVEFDGRSSISGGLNNLNIQIYNLNEDNRKSLVKDAEESDKLISVELQIGYDGNLITEFVGNAETAGTTRSGTNLLTKLECLDGGHAQKNSFTSSTITKRKEAIEKLLEDMEGITLGYIPEIEETIRPNVMVGCTFDIIKEYLKDDETFFIDGEKLYIVKNNQVIGDFIPLVYSDTGLKNTPQRKDKIVTFDTVINPEIRIGRLVELISTTAIHLNGIYKVQGYQYKGDTHGSDWTQTCECIAWRD